MASNKTLTYSQLEAKLLQLGFHREPAKDDLLFYRHPRGAMIVLASYPPTTPLDPRLQMMVDVELRDYGLAESGAVAG